MTVSSAGSQHEGSQQVVLPFNGWTTGQRKACKQHEKDVPGLRPQHPLYHVGNERVAVYKAS